MSKGNDLLAEKQMDTNLSSQFQNTGATALQSNTTDTTSEDSTGSNDTTAVSTNSLEADKSSGSPLSGENPNELNVLAEIRELIKNASSNLHSESQDFIARENNLHQRHRAGLGENRIDNQMIKQVSYDEFPSSPSNNVNEPEKQTERISKKPGAVDQSDSDDQAADEPDASVSSPTKSSLETDRTLTAPTGNKAQLQKADRQKAFYPSKGKAVVKDLSKHRGSILQTLLQKMESLKESTERQQDFYTGGVALGAIFAGVAHTGNTY